MCSFSKGRLVDSDSSFVIGQPYIRQKIDRQELARVAQGFKTSSVLFEGIDGRLFKTGYAPLWNDQQIVGFVAVEGSAATLRAVRDMQNRLLQVGLVAIIFSLVVALLIAGQITSPLKKLQQAAERFGKGNLEQPVKISGKDEIAFLGKTMDEMRRSILQRDERQKAMLAGVAHEIRNPLGGIELFASMLADELPAGEAKDQAHKILKEARNLKGIVQDFLDYAKPIVPKRAKCSLNECFSEAEMLLMDDLQKKQVRIEKHIDAQIFADPQHIKQAFLNLTKNAIQAMPNGGTIQITAENNNRKVIIRFSDNGHGVKSDIADKIFDPFFTTQEKGLGLGLSMVKNLIEENGGSIELQSTGASGTTFEIKLPMA